ncbi:dUTP pyrophosphatase [Epithele typhae]|uniref:dUTP pyrophosphatase n=1 Tax=Epithele typhae TaxID=378194 RepID=UPI002008268E|nr:dUTP pyrophosphatase [Epithele typhae]KAH9927151.1 dUTP pyrophosphatase [Epithele typhae]
MSDVDAPQNKKRKLAPVAGLLIKRHSEKARIPSRGSALAAGYDLYSAETKVIPARGKALVDTQISVAVPAGTYGRVAPRSGLASKFMIDTGRGSSTPTTDFTVNEGDRVAQLILERIVT